MTETGEEEISSLGCLVFAWIWTLFSYEGGVKLEIEGPWWPGRKKILGRYDSAKKNDLVLLQEISQLR